MKLLIKGSNGWVEDTPTVGEAVRYEYPDGHSVETIYSIEVPKVTKITVGAFRRRLTLQEKLDITGSSEVICRVLLDDLASSSYVDLMSLELKAGLEALVGLSLLSPERVSELLSEGTEEER